MHQLARKDAALGMDQREFLAGAALAGTELGSAATTLSAKTVHSPWRRERAIVRTAVISERRDFPLAERLHSTSTIISTSTALLEGSPAIPKAERACLPIASPNTSTINQKIRAYDAMRNFLESFNISCSNGASSSAVF